MKVEKDNDKEKKRKIKIKKKKIKNLPPEEIIKELEDKLARAFAEMENQRRRLKKKKEDAFEYGGTSFAKEALNLIDNLQKIKTSIRE